MKDRFFNIVDIDATICVEFDTRKSLLEVLDEFIENVKFRNEHPETTFICVDDDSFEILYDDGSMDFIDKDYDGHKIRRTHIVSICNLNSATAVVFGHFEINDAGVVYAAAQEKIDETNIIEVDSFEYRQAQ